MPIYELYCPDCHTIFSFLSRTVNTTKRPSCPRCRKRKLERQISLFAVTGKAEEGGGPDDLPLDESKMEQAMTALAGEAEKINEDDPKGAAELMRKFSRMTGLKLGNGLEEALSRMEAGEDPEQIESEMGDLIDGEDPFVLSDGHAKAGQEQKRRKSAPRKDPTLYEM
jgi:putative FmdB family regulatory protein